MKDTTKNFFLVPKKAKKLGASPKDFEVDLKA